MARPSEIITSLRHKAELAKEAKTIIKVGANARYCPAGHCFARTLLLQRQRSLQEAQELSCLPPIACDGCSEDIKFEEEYIAGCCKVCDIDFCVNCFESGRPIDEMLQEGLESEIGMSMSSLGGAGEMIIMSPTKEYCGAGHQLGRVSSIMRRRHLQERDGLSAPPTIECDCCSKQITNHTLCCLECDIDFCEDCFQSGQSFETFFEDMQEGDDDDDADLLDKQKKESRNARRRQKQLSGRQRYDGRRPTYKGTGRVSYDEFPDPTAFQWTFTGSCESTCVEFFEKDYAKRGVVKLDFYYTEGTVSTVLEHRRNGETALLGKKSELKPKTYRKILLHPQKCTDERYKKNRRKLVV
jgi:hypothetical protein